MAWPLPTPAPFGAMRHLAQLHVVGLGEDLWYCAWCCARHCAWAARCSRKRLGPKQRAPVKAPAMIGFSCDSYPLAWILVRCSASGLNAKPREYTSLIPAVQEGLDSSL